MGVEYSTNNNVNLESKNTMNSDPSIADHGRKPPFGGGVKGQEFLFSRVRASRSAKPDWEKREAGPGFSCPVPMMQNINGEWIATFPNLGLAEGQWTLENMIPKPY